MIPHDRYIHLYYLNEMIHVVVVTDDHSWVAGQGRHSQKYNADYGHILSFYEHLRNNNDNQGLLYRKNHHHNHNEQQEEEEPHHDDDTFLVMNGDFMDGTGLSTYPPIHLIPILQSMPWDAMTLGNHDIYKNETIQLLSNRKNGNTGNGGLMEEKYMVTSNLVHTSTRRPFGRQFLYLHGKNSDTNILVFGFIVDNIDTTKVGSPLVRIVPIAEVVKQDWFLDVLVKKMNNNNNPTTAAVDAILILAHMGTDDPAITILLKTIRTVVGPDMPIQFVTGHTHLIRSQILDPCATAVEAGKYLETIGIVSFPTKDMVINNKTSNSNITDDRNNNSTSSSSSSSCDGLFSHEFLPANIDILSKRVNVSNLMTPRGKAVTDLIQTTQETMGLRRLVGCTPQTYYLNQTLHSHDALFGLWKQVLEKQFFNNNKLLPSSSSSSPGGKQKQQHAAVVLQGTRSSFRHNLYKGVVTMDDILIVSPFNDTMYLVARNIDESTLVRLTQHMNSLHYHMDGFVLPDFVSLRGNNKKSNNAQQQSSRLLLDLYTLEYEVPFIRQGLQHVLLDDGDKSLLSILESPIPVPTAAATSLWLEFFESHWPTCQVHKKTSFFLEHHADGGQPPQVLPPPDMIIVGLAVASAIIALFLSIAFVCRPSYWKMMVRRSL